MPAAHSVTFAAVVVAAFGVYWLSSFFLAASGWTAMTKFSADTGWYSVMADGYVIDREARFHPVTVVLALAWMKALGPLTVWITPLQLLKALFAALGALGVAAAMWAFTAVVPRRYVVVCGLIYASSFALWYFSAIEESKIVTASLSALYIAIYLHLRDHWTPRGAAALTTVLLLACLNEVVAVFLVVIPFVDTLMRRGWDWRHGRWIAAHALVGPAAFAFLELVVNGTLVKGSTDPEQASLLSHLFHYISQNDYSAKLYLCVVNWLFFSIAAPSPTALHGASPVTKFPGDFEPVLSNYFASPLSAGVVALACVIVAATVLRRDRSEPLESLTAVITALAAYALIRGTFFMIYLPGDPILNSPAVSLAHLMIVLIPFAASRFPAKRAILGAFAILLFFSNGMFFISQ